MQPPRQVGLAPTFSIPANLDCQLCARGPFARGAARPLGRPMRSSAAAGNLSPLAETDPMLHPDFGGDAKRILAALGKSLAIIEFKVDGTILTANAELLRRDGVRPLGNPRQAPQHVRRFGIRAQPGVPGVLGQARPRRVRSRRIPAGRQRRQGRLDSSDLQSGRLALGTRVEGREGGGGHDRGEAEDRRKRPASSTRFRARKP